MKSDKIILIKTGQVVGYLYIPPIKTNKVVIMAKGGPSLGDEGNSSLWPTIKKFNWMLFVPDYIGYCRSDGKFNFKNSVLTLHQSEDFLRGNSIGIDTLTGQEISIKCSEILLVGSSWGGAIVPFLEKYKKSSINTIALLKPLTDWITQGRTKDPEENIDQTNTSIINGLLNIYRGYDNSEWPKIFSGKDKEYNPLDNLRFLNNKTVFICHGSEDESINWKKSYLYYQKLKKLFPKQKIFWKLYKSDHSGKLNTKALKFILPTLDKLLNT